MENLIFTLITGSYSVEKPVETVDKASFSVLNAIIHSFSTGRMRPEYFYSECEPDSPEQ